MGRVTKRMEFPVSDERGSVFVFLHELNLTGGSIDRVERACLEYLMRHPDQPNELVVLNEMTDLELAHAEFTLMFGENAGFKNQPETHVVVLFGGYNIFPDTRGEEQERFKRPHDQRMRQIMPDNVLLVSFVAQYKPYETLRRDYRMPNGYGETMAERWQGQSYGAAQDKRNWTASLLDMRDMSESGDSIWRIKVLEEILMWGRTRSFFRFAPVTEYGTWRSQPAAEPEQVLIEAVNDTGLSRKFSFSPDEGDTRTQLHVYAYNMEIGEENISQIGQLGKRYLKRHPEKPDTLVILNDMEDLVAAELLFAYRHGETFKNESTTHVMVLFGGYSLYPGATHDRRMEARQQPHERISKVLPQYPYVVAAMEQYKPSAGLRMDYRMPGGFGDVIAERWQGTTQQNNNLRRWIGSLIDLTALHGASVWWKYRILEEILEWAGTYPYFNPHTRGEMAEYGDWRAARVETHVVDGQAVPAPDAVTVDMSVPDYDQLVDDEPEPEEVYDIDRSVNVALAFITRTADEARREADELRARVRQYREELLNNVRRLQVKEAEIKGLLDPEPYRNKLKRQLESLSKYDKITGIRVEYVSGADRLVFTTKKLYMTDDKGRYFLAGAYDIAVSMSGGYDIRFRNLSPDMRRRSFWGDYCHHPHVSGSEWGNACFGDAETHLAEMIGEYDVEGVVNIVINFLEAAYTNDAAGKNVVRWPLVDRETGEILRDNPNYTAVESGCAECGHEFDEDDEPYTCEGCHATLCEDCGRTDDHGDRYCESCYDDRYTTCYQCSGELYREGEFTYYSPGGDAYCARCYYENYEVCAYCGEVGDPSDMEYDPEGSEKYCHSCWDDRYTTCIICDANVHREDVRWNSDGEPVCGDCQSEVWHTCDECGEETEEDLEYDEESGQDVCGDCAERLRESREEEEEEEEEDANGDD